MNSPPLLSPRERLAISHQAIVRQMGHASSAAGDTVTDDEAREIDASSSTWALARQMAGVWWRGHPAHLAVELVTPVLKTYAEEKPLKLLGIAAGAGAAVVLLRPWRLMSLTGILLAALKSSQMSGVVSSLLARSHKVSSP